MKTLARLLLPSRTAEGTAPAAHPRGVHGASREAKGSTGGAFAELLRAAHTGDLRRPAEADAGAARSSSLAAKRGAAAVASPAAAVPSPAAAPPSSPDVGTGGSEASRATPPGAATPGPARRGPRHGVTPATGDQACNAGSASSGPKDSQPATEASLAVQGASQPPSASTAQLAAATAVAAAAQLPASSKATPAAPGEAQVAAPVREGPQRASAAGPRDPQDGTPSAHAAQPKEQHAPAAATTAAPGPSRRSTEAPRDADPRSAQGPGQRHAASGAAVPASGTPAASSSSGPEVSPRPSPEQAAAARAPSSSPGDPTSSAPRLASAAAGSRPSPAKASSAGGDREAEAHPAATPLHPEPQASGTTALTDGPRLETPRPRVQEPSHLPALPADPGETVVSGAVLSSTAHLHVSSEALGELALHLRIQDGAASLRMEGADRSAVEAHAPELVRALAAEGIGLARIELTPRGGSDPGTGGGQGPGADGRPQQGGGSTGSSSQEQQRSESASGGPALHGSTPSPRRTPAHDGQHDVTA